MIGGHWRVRVRALDVESSSPVVDTGYQPLSTDWSEWIADLPSGSPASVSLVLDAFLPQQDTRVEIRSPSVVLLEREGDFAGQPAEQPSRLMPPERFPDIYMIILDAARADHIGAYGYPRATTPQIDRVARRSLTFQRVYSECPSTSCSVANFMTGLAFPGLDIDPKISRLPDHVDTLPEILGERGYYTIGVSANPNNSAFRNVDQGYDLFRAMWNTRVKEKGRRVGNDRASTTAMSPYRLVLSARRALGRAPNDRPVFAMLHFVPPHEPYSPRRRFDVFGDPDYRGQVRPGMQLGPLRFGRVSFDRADRKRLLDLYDGHLLMADDAVGGFISHLRATGRWDDALVVIMADHGEAFFEHGHQGHNTTLYDEMLHVPLILRLPDWMDPGAVDLETAAALADLVPTLTRAAGGIVPEAVNGADLLSSESRRNRIIFHRWALAEPKRFAARTSRWKSLHRAKSYHLYDLETDPGERNDCSTDHPIRALSLGVAIQQHVAKVRAQWSQVANEEMSGEVPEDDRIFLEALGYVD